jgi:hypothetical protein
VQRAAARVARQHPQHGASTQRPRLF